MQRETREHGVSPFPYQAAFLLASTADTKNVQVRMRHASARTTLDTYGHLLAGCR
jgi:integrase